MFFISSLSDFISNFVSVLSSAQLSPQIEVYSAFPLRIRKTPISSPLITVFLKSIDPQSQLSPLTSNYPVPKSDSESFYNLYSNPALITLDISIFSPASLTTSLVLDIFSSLLLFINSSEFNFISLSSSNISYDKSLCALTLPCIASFYALIPYSYDSQPISDFSITPHFSNP